MPKRGSLGQHCLLRLDGGRFDLGQRPSCLASAAALTLQMIFQRVLGRFSREERCLSERSGYLSTVLAPTATLSSSVDSLGVSLREICAIQHPTSWLVRSSEAQFLLAGPAPLLIAGSTAS